MELHLQWKNEWNVPTAVGVLTFGLGTAVGYFLGTRRGKVVEEISYDKEEDQMTFTFFEDDDIEEAVSSKIMIAPVVFDDLIEKINPDDYPEDEPEEDEEPLPDPEDIFPPVTPGWDYAEEVPKRTADAPYIIHRDEFFGEEAEGYIQSTLMYYKGDDILVDEQDVPIYDRAKVVCELEFGKGSEDPSIVYIRNDKLEAEYEVILDRGLFQVEVLGAQLEHSFDKKTPLHKFKE